MRKIFILGMSMLPSSKFKATMYKTQALPVVDYPIHFPIVNLIANDVQASDQVVLVSVHNDSENAKNNDELFQEEATKVLKRKRYIWEPIIFKNEDGKEYIKLFDKIVKFFQKGDVVYVDITYGFKALPVVLFAALSYKLKRAEINVRYVIYGEFYDGTEGHTEGKLRDLSPIFYLNAQIGEIAGFEVNSGKKIMKDILDR